MGGIGAVLVGTAIAALMQTFLTVSLPTAAAEVGAMAWYGWVASLYLVSSTAFIPALAGWADRAGPRDVYAVSFAVWGVATFALGHADTALALLGWRVVQGIGAAGIVPAGISALALTNEKRFGKLVGLMGAVQAVAIFSGGPLGGWMASVWGWRAALSIVAYASVIPVGLALACMPAVRSVPDRNVNLRLLLRRAGVGAVLWQAIAIAGVSFGTVSYLPLMLEQVHGLSVRSAGWAAAPCLGGVAVGALLGGSWPDSRLTKNGTWGFMSVGALMCLAPHPVAVSAGGALVSVGAGSGLSRQMILLERITTAKGAAAAGGLMQFARNCGGAVASAVLGLPMSFGMSATRGAMFAFFSLALFACGLAVVRLLVVTVQRRSFLSNWSGRTTPNGGEPSDSNAC